MIKSKLISSTANMKYQKDKNKMTFKQWLMMRLVEKGISQRKLSSILNLDQASLSRTLDGKRRLQIHEANAIADFFDVPLQEVLDRFGISSGAIKEVNLVGTIDSDGKFQELDKPVKVKAIPQGEHLEAIQWRSDNALDGFIFHIEKDPVSVETDKLGLLHLSGGQSIVGVAMRGYLPNRYRIATINDGKLEDVEVLSMNRVKAVLPP